jgi:hypothetical protein
MAEVCASAVETEIIEQYSEQEATILVALLSRFYDGQSAFGGTASEGVVGVRPLNRRTGEFSGAS